MPTTLGDARSRLPGPPGSADLSDRRSGLEAQPRKAETKQEKKAEKGLQRRARAEAKAEQPGADVSWLPWMVGMSLGLVIGLVGVAYWQRRRLQALWERTSQRMQQATGEARKRLEAARSQPPQIQSDMPTGTPQLRQLGLAAPATDSNQQVNGRMESTSQ